MADHPHDLFDWASVIAPTLATLAAAGAAVWAASVGRQVSRDGLALQRRMSGPRLTILERLHAVPNSGLEWVLDLRNDGQTAANIESFRVLVDGKALDGRPLEDPTAYWKTVLAAAGLIRYGSLQGNRFVPPVSMPPNAPHLIVQAVLVDSAQQVQQCLRRLRFEIGYASLWGENLTLTFECGAL